MAISIVFAAGKSSWATCAPTQAASAQATTHAIQQATKRATLCPRLADSRATRTASRPPSVAAAALISARKKEGKR